MGHCLYFPKLDADHFCYIPHPHRTFIIDGYNNRKIGKKFCLLHDANMSLQLANIGLGE